MPVILTAPLLKTVGSLNDKALNMFKTLYCSITLAVMVPLFTAVPPEEL